MLKNKFKNLKKFKVRKILVLDYKKRNDYKICASANLIDSDSDIDQGFISMHQSITTKMRNYASEYCIVLDVNKKHSIKIFECWYGENKWRITRRTKSNNC